jgi:hypothetical protein
VGSQASVNCAQPLHCQIRSPPLCGPDVLILPAPVYDDAALGPPLEVRLGRSSSVGCVFAGGKRKGQEIERAKIFTQPHAALSTRPRSAGRPPADKEHAEECRIY